MKPMNVVHAEINPPGLWRPHCIPTRMREPSTARAVVARPYRSRQQSTGTVRNGGIGAALGVPLVYVPKVMAWTPRFRSQLSMSISNTRLGRKFRVTIVALGSLLRQGD